MTLAGSAANGQTVIPTPSINGTVNYESLGSSVALSGDVMVVGADGEIGGIPGVVNIYTNDSGAWTLLQSISSPISDSSGGFGYAVAINGNNIIIGSPSRRLMTRAAIQLRMLVELTFLP